MPDEFDPLDWLKAHDPLAGTDTPSTVADAEREAILDRLRRRSPSRRRRSRRLIPVVAAAAVLAASGGVAVAYLVGHSRSPSPADVLCFAEVDLDSSRAAIDRRDDPLASCAAAWRDPQHAEVFDGRSPPPLALCRLQSGIEAAFPADDGDPCRQLDLLAAADTDMDDDAAVAELTDRMATSMDQGCVSIEQAATLAAEAIDLVGLGHWGVHVPDTADDACASVYIDTAAALVRIIPLPTTTPPPSD